jgi:hypothetical protein
MWVIDMGDLLSALMEHARVLSSCTKTSFQSQRNCDYDDEERAPLYECLQVSYNLF